MAGPELQYFKFVTKIIDAGIWAQMSPAARTLYPVLMRFSDRDFKPVYPGSAKLLELTGFKHKVTLRKARNELVDLGLIAITRGTGRTNTTYLFRFDTLTPQGDAAIAPRKSNLDLSGDGVLSTEGTSHEEGRGSTGTLPYNQIHISINNHVLKQDDEKSRFEILNQKFGSETVELAKTECTSVGLPVTAANVERILAKHESTWAGILAKAKSKVSDASFRLVQDAFLDEHNGIVYVADSLPEFLKTLLSRLHPSLVFEPQTKLQLAKD
jgi:hypothetical protein